MSAHKKEGDKDSLLQKDEDEADGVGANPFGEAVAETELQEIQTIQTEVVDITAKLWAADEMTDEEAEELERQSNLLKYKLAMASSAVKEWGMQQALERIQDHENRRKWHDPAKSDHVKKVAMQMAPIAFGFMLLVGLASQVHFDDSRLIPGQIYALAGLQPFVYPLGSSSHMVEVRIQIPSLAAPGSSSSGGHRRNSARRNSARDWLTQVTQHRRAGKNTTLPGKAPPAANPPSKTPAPAAGKTPAKTPAPAPAPPAVHEVAEGPRETITAYLFNMPDNGWLHRGFDGHGNGKPSLDNLTAQALEPPEKIAEWVATAEGELPVMIEFELLADPSHQLFVLGTSSGDALPVAVSLHSLGPTGPYQVVIAGFILTFVFGLIVTEVLHRCMAAMLGAALTLTVLAAQHRVPNLAKTVGWMDHGTLALLWGMMIIVGVTTRTGVFEWTGVVACKLSGGSKKKLLLLLCLVTAILSAFLDNVTTILLISPVTIKLCSLVNQNPIPYLISEAIYSNLGGTATMIGDPPNIIIGNMLSKWLGFNDFLFNLCPGVILSCPAVFYFLLYFWKEEFEGQLKADIPKLQRLYPITDPALLVKCGAVLACVISSFFLHPVTHFDPAWVAILGAVWLLVAFDMHHCHEALHGVEWDTLLFFAALFVIVEGLGELGLLRFVASTLGGMIAEAPIASRQYFAIGLILWSSAFFSAFVDNIPFTATMVPILKQLAADVPGIAIEPLAWALAFGACFGGNGTLIGASANIVMAGKAAAEGHHITFVYFFKVGMPAMIISMVTATMYMMVLNAAVYQASTDAAGLGP